MSRHIAMIPARMGSVGFKHKNRKFFDYTANFLDKIEWFDKVIVSTDDPVLKDYSKKRDYEIHNRPENLAGPAISIKQVFESVINNMDIKNDDILWLFYLPILYKNPDDFEKCKEIIEKDKVKSVCSFIKAKTHPYVCWNYDSEKEILTQYIKNDCFRRQDQPPAWEHHHYLYCFKVKEISNLNNEMLNSKTQPIFINEETAENLLEMDMPSDYEKWKKKYRKEVIEK
jgi:CMP-N-acetylneuraminic acid synthetase